MIKEFLNDTLELDRFLASGFLLKKSQTNRRNSRRGISKEPFNKLPRPKKSFFTKEVKNVKTASEFTSLDRIRIVFDSLIKDLTVEQICEEENIQANDYYKWKSDFLNAFNRYSEETLIREKITLSNKKLILRLAGDETYAFYKKYIKNLRLSRSLVIPPNEQFTSYSNFYPVENVFILDRMNNFRMINKHLEGVNKKLPNGGLLLGCFETFNDRYKKDPIARIPLFKYLYFGSEFTFKRVMPKLPFLKKLYFTITKGKNRLLSKAEALGRLVCCGFEIIDVKVINDIHYFVAKKVKEPCYDMNPSYGPLFKMKRVGKDGKIIGVYKLRTMHPYSEYLQDYILKLNGYSKTGKPANDFRLVPWSKFLRRYWLDEMPQLINVLKGDLKLVGVRPVSQRYFRDIPLEIQQLRLTQKPGCIPPYVALNRVSSVDSVLQAEKEYLLEKIENPYFTDTKYFFKAIFNIVFKRKRSA